MKKTLNKLIISLVILAVVMSGTALAGGNLEAPALRLVMDAGDMAEPPTMKIMNTRSEEYILEELTDYVWNSNNWIENFRMFRTFTGQSNIATETYQGWNGSAWVNSQRQDNVYNDEDQLTKIAWWQWSSGGWRLFLFTDITYNDDGLMEQAHSYFGVNPEILESFSYNDDNQVEEYLYQTRDIPTGDYENSKRRLYSYTVNGGYDEIVSQSWGGSEWKNDSKLKFLYDTESRLSERIEYSFFAGDWQQDIRYLFGYDIDGFMYVAFIQTYGGSAWSDNARVFYYYNDNGTLEREEKEVIDPIEDWVFESKREYKYRQFTTDVTDFGDPLPEEFTLGQNYPNPFNMSTVIGFSLPSRENVSLDIYNILGQKVVTVMNEILPAGNHTVTWDGHDRFGREIPSGVYFYQMKTDSGDRTHKMLLVK